MKTNIITKLFWLIFIIASMAISCRIDPPVNPSTDTGVTDGEVGEVKGFFLLNEGNMGNNKATLDYFDYETGIYSRNIYAERNPGVTFELGDVGNDIAIYGGKLYAVINCSNLVEIMDMETARHITNVSIPNCRYITFHEGFAYVSSYAGAVETDPNYRRGYVAKIDTVSMQVIDTCNVGYQPEEMAVANGKLYVANSGGYMAPNYDNTVSVIDLGSFEVLKTIEVAPNLRQVKQGKNGLLYVSSRGDYYGNSSATYIIDPITDKVVKELPLLPNSDMTMKGDSIYVIAHEWSNITQNYETHYAIFNTRDEVTVSRNFITDGSESKIITPYGIAVNPVNGDIFVTDAKDHVTPGKIHCYTPDGKLKWSATTGDIPAHIVFTHKRLKNIQDI